MRQRSLGKDEARPFLAGEEQKETRIVGGVECLAVIECIVAEGSLEGSGGSHGHSEGRGQIVKGRGALRRQHGVGGGL